MTDSTRRGTHLVGLALAGLGAMALGATALTAAPAAAQTLWPTVGSFAVTQVPPGDQNAPAAPTDQTPAPAADAQGLSDGAKQGIGCLITSGTALTWGYIAGPSELIMVAAGGILSPSATSTLTIALIGTLGASSCALGAAATPATLALPDTCPEAT